MKRFVSLLSAVAGLSATGFNPALAADVNVPRTITTNTTWTADNTYFISGYTFVVSPAVLTINPGTVIKGRPKGAGTEAAALVITRGAKIEANGNAAQPIIFTAEADNLAGNLGPDDSNLWGGLVILGNAAINSRANGDPAGTPAQDQVEGFSVVGAEVGYITFGGTNDADDSGTLRYVSIRHGGEVVGTANEINGLTLGGVGSETLIEYIEVFANKDDGVEFFGGTVDLKYAVTAFGKDDGFDYDQGWRGRGQFWVTLGGASTVESADKGGEWDGATSPLDATPIGGTSVFNATFIGNGTGGINNTALNIRDNAIAKVYNSVFVDYNKMIDIEDDNLIRFTAGDVDFANNVWWSHVGANNTAAGLNARPAGAVNASTFWSNAAKNNQIANPDLRGISRTANAGLDPRPASTSPALRGPFATVPAGGWYTQTSYKGAFSPVGPTWIQGWTKLSRDGYLAQVTDPLVPGSSQRLINLSNRCFIGTGDSIAIPGIVIGGTEPKQVLVRVIGTDGLTQFGVAGTLADPTLEIKLGDTTIYANDDWATATNFAAAKAAAVGVQAFTIPDNAKDAVLLVTLEPGAYTILASGKNATSGVVIIEVWAIN